MVEIHEGLSLNRFAPLPHAVQRGATISPEFLSSLIAEIYSSEAARDRWRGFLARLSTLCGVASVCFVTAAAADDRSHYASNAAVREAAAVFRQSVKRDSQEMRNAAEYAARRGSPSRMVLSAASSLPCVCPYTPPGFMERKDGFVLHGADEGNWSQAEAKTFLNLLSPHMTAAISLHEKLLARSSSICAQTQAMEMFDIAVLMLGRTGKVLDSTRAALPLLQQELSVQQGMLRAQVASEDAQLQQLLACALEENKSGQQTIARTMTLARPHPVEPLQVVVKPIYPPAGGDSCESPAVLVFLCDPGWQPSSRLQTLAVLYALSPTESRLIGYLVDGMKPRNAAEALRLTENTTRFHLKQIFRKMGVNSQTALLRVVLGLPGTGQQRPR